MSIVIIDSYEVVFADSVVLVVTDNEVVAVVFGVLLLLVVDAVVDREKIIYLINL